MTPLKGDIRQADQSQADLSDTVQRHAATQRGQFTVTAARAPWLVLLATAVISVLTSILALAIVRSILTPIGEHRRATNAWGQGDLSQTLGQRGNDEIAEVKRDLGAM